MDQTFSGGVMSERLAGGRASAEIALTPSGVSAQSPDGQRFIIPYREAQVEVGGFNGRMVFCRDAQRTLTIFCDDHKFSRELSTASSGILDDQLSAGKKRVRGQGRRETVIGLVSLVVILLLIVGGFFGVRYAGRVAVHSMPVGIDRQLGKTAFESMDLGGDEVHDKIVVGAIEEMVKQLAPHASLDGLRFEVHVIDSSELNAFCLPGGVIVVYTGLMAAAKTPEQVAAVISHEMSHATLRHGMERASGSLGIWAAGSLLLGDTSGVIAGGVDLFQLAVVNHYSREQEDAADAEGVRMLHAANIDPSAMADFFKIMEHRHGDVPDLLAWISTHPQHADRIASVTAMVDGLPPQPYAPIAMDWQKVQNRLPATSPIASGKR